MKETIALALAFGVSWQSARKPMNTQRSISVVPIGTDLFGSLALVGGGFTAVGKIIGGICDAHSFPARCC
jgi:hypothetical protein